MPEPQTSSSSNVRHSLLHSETLSRVLGEDAMRVLRCGICMNFFEVPIVLPCGHTFCLQCLTQMCTHASVSHAPNTSQDVRIGCPNCHVLIYATPILRRNVTCNFIVQSLIECLGVREDKGTFRPVNTEGCGDPKASFPSSSPSSAPPTIGFDDDHHSSNSNSAADVSKMLSDLDRVTVTLARSNVVDRAFMEIEDIRREHLARERQRQAERDAKTRDQVRAVQSIMKQSREEEQQQQQQRKHQHHHFQQQQQQQQRQLQQRQILTRPHQILDAKPQQPQQLLQQQSTPTTPTTTTTTTNLPSQPLNLFLWKCPLLTPMSNTDISLAPATPTKPPQQPLQQSAPCNTQTITTSSKQQPQPNQPTTSQQQQQPPQRYSPHVFQHMGRDDPFNSPQHTNKDPHSPHQPPAPPQPPPPVATPPPAPQPQPYQHPQHSARKVIPSLKQPTGTIATASPNQTPLPTAINTIQGTQFAPDKQHTSNMAPETRPGKSPLPGNESLQGGGVSVAMQPSQALNVNHATSDLQCVQLNNDPAVMSFSLMTAMTSASSK